MASLQSNKLDDLATFMIETSGEEWVLMETDCVPWIKRWYERSTGGSLILPKYVDLKTTIWELNKAGGTLVAAVSKFCDQNNIPETKSPVRGDIAVVNHPLALKKQTTAICFGDRYAVRSKINGKAVNTLLKIEPIKSWSVQVAI